MIRTILVVVAFLVASPAVAAHGDTPLFDSSDVLHISMSGPISALTRSSGTEPRPGTLTVVGTGQALPVSLAVRSTTRRQSDVCQFPPLKVQFPSPPPPNSVFAGQRSLKLVTHCRSSASFQQYVLLEYATYRMLNVLSPMSFRVRLASIDYVDESGRPIISRYGFFIEDLRDVAKRNGMQQANLPELIPLSSLEPQHSALYAMFQDMIANHDWSMRAGPKGKHCCHNAEMIAPAKGVAANVIPVPYDFDFSGLVDTPYATPPDALHISSVRQRQYRGYCIHNPQAIAAAAQMRAAKPQMYATLAATPGIEPQTVAKATAYLDQFFTMIATDQAVQANVLKSCV
jgi:hypothetical protein